MSVKRGQVTIFIIIGLLVIISFLLISVVLTETNDGKDTLRGGPAT